VLLIEAAQYAVQERALDSDRGVELTERIGSEDRGCIEWPDLAWRW
jgi:hypothetical protein